MTSVLEDQNTLVFVWELVAATRNQGPWESFESQQEGVSRSVSEQTLFYNHLMKVEFVFGAVK